MKNYKHAYWVNGNGEPCYTAFTEPHAELIVAISSNNAIISDETHDFVKKFDQNLNFLSAYVFDFNNKTISVNIEVAKKIVLGFIKNRRDQALKDLDTEQLKYMTDQTKLIKIESVKQQLRDLPVQALSSMANCSDLTDLNHILPPILVSYKEMI